MIDRNAVLRHAAALGFRVEERDGELMVYATTGRLVARYAAPGRSYLMLLDVERVEIPFGATVVAVDGNDN